MDLIGLSRLLLNSFLALNLQELRESSLLLRLERHLLELLTPLTTDFNCLLSDLLIVCAVPLPSRIHDCLPDLILVKGVPDAPHILL